MTLIARSRYPKEVVLVPAFGYVGPPSTFSAVSVYAPSANLPQFQTSLVPPVAIGHHQILVTSLSFF